MILLMYLSKSSEIITFKPLSLKDDLLPSHHIFRFSINCSQWLNGCILQYKYNLNEFDISCLSGICVTVWSPETGWPSWASTPSRKWPLLKAEAKRRLQEWVLGLHTCEWWESRWTQRAQVKEDGTFCLFSGRFCSLQEEGKILVLFFVRSWSYRIRVSTGRGGAEGAGRYSWRLPRTGSIRGSVHLRQWRLEEGHYLSAVWRLQEEVRL